MSSKPKSDSTKSVRRQRQWLTGNNNSSSVRQYPGVGRAAELITFPGEVSNTELLRQGALSLADYYEGQAIKLGCRSQYGST